MGVMFAKRFKEARQRSGLKQKEVAQQLKVALSLPGSWERGERMPSVAKLEALAKLFGVTVSWLTGEQVKEGTEIYGKRAEYPAAILADYTAPHGLREMASNQALIEALGVSPDEWARLCSFDAPERFSRDGYVAVLMAMRAYVT